ncbi:1-aminocyclopropane-1-carboxylate deaminase/D-cysteine desulfhydrase [uncultured Paraglaciecola sp.]|uniref:1-aminocyclopropane-1-carboxylate deaminase/D-cysteine desulfhydrase n=1 Tax=uncultured Paraglaciecola sp. TaxID=1765024 RepID=UPI002634F511|nr:pyridoxal-phosphate dependent enzyme [uncultured Paraglaciecola sp.]
MTPQQLGILLGIQTPSPTHSIQPNWQGIENLQISIKRDDLIHPIISGNKWRKLKYALLEAVNTQTQHIVSFGGGFSNHLHALGYCCERLNIGLTAIVRGDYSKNPSPMLQDLANWQTNIQYVDRNTYQQRSNADYLQNLQHQNPNAMVIPEGGSWQHAMTGVTEIISELQTEYDYILMPVGSGGTLAGIISATQQTKAQVMGIAVLKGADYLEQLVSELLPQDQATYSNWQINHQHHFGGYAKSNTQLKQFCDEFHEQTHISIEPVYSGKLFFALKTLVEQRHFPLDSKILAIHTGGLQGARSQ